MSQENFDRMGEGIDAMNRRDINAVLVGMHPEVRFEHRLAALQGSFVGVESVRGWFADLIETFDTWRISCEDIRDLGDGVLALGTIHATGRESGVETEFPLSIVARYREWPPHRVHRLRRPEASTRSRRAVRIALWTTSGHRRRGCDETTAFVEERRSGRSVR